MASEYGGCASRARRCSRPGEEEDPTSPSGLRASRGRGWSGPLQSAGRRGGPRLPERPPSEPRTRLEWAGRRGGPRLPERPLSEPRTRLEWAGPRTVLYKREARVTALSGGAPVARGARAAARRHHMRLRTFVKLCVYARNKRVYSRE